MVSWTFMETLVPVTCCKCGVTFGLVAGHHSDLQRSGNMFYCPNGHGQVYSDDLDKQLERAKQQAQRERDRFLMERERKEAAQRSAAAYRGQVTKIKRRVGAGKCPCCRSHFKNLQEHMTETHPGWSDE